MTEKYDYIASKMALYMISEGLNPLKGIELLKDMINIMEKKLKKGEENNQNGKKHRILGS